MNTNSGKSRHARAASGAALWLAGASLLVAALPAHAGPFARGNPQEGRALLEKSCIACHRSLFGGDGSKIYTRPGHKVRTPEQLLSRIRTCNTNAGAGWYPEEEMHVAAYLNLRYYHFK